MKPDLKALRKAAVRMRDIDEEDETEVHMVCRIWDQRVNAETILCILDRLERYEKALEFYANIAKSLKVPDDWDFQGMGGPPDVDQLEEIDIGELAREALGDG